MVLNCPLRLKKTFKERLRRQVKRYNKNYSDEMVHMHTKRLPLLKEDLKNHAGKYLLVGIDDFLRELYARIYLGNTSFLQCVYRIKLTKNTKNQLIIKQMEK